jgi:molybdopterin molybdotransferase
MISVQEALSIIIENIPQGKTELLPLNEAHGRVLADQLIAPEASPRFTNSAMDGFAVRWDDVKKTDSVHGVSLRVIGESHAGIPFAGDVLPGTAVKINTGAILPDGSDTVIPVEETESSGGTVTVRTVKKRQQHVRFQGEEFAEGEILLDRATALNPARIALLAAVGISKVNVYRRPRVAVIVTGTEVQPYDSDIESYQIRDSNGVMLKTAIQQSGGEVAGLIKVEDNLAKTEQAIVQAQEGSDMILCSGGGSVGEHDHVKDAAANAGFVELFWRVRQKPGKPLYFARKDDTLFFGLPGNPVAAIMGYVYYIQPVLQGLQGRPHQQRVVRANLLHDVTNTGKRSNFFRVQIEQDENGKFFASVLPKQGSHMLRSMALADGFFMADAGDSLAAGTEIAIMPFPWK